MPVTLAQASLNAVSALDLSVINEFRSSQLLDLVTFDDCVNPQGGGSTLSYGYTRQITTPTAAFRAINSEYTPSEVSRGQFYVNLKPLGGSFQVDRVLAGIGPAASNDVALNMAEKIRAAQATFANGVVNGDTTVDANSFDGLSKMLAGTTTEDTAVYDFSAGVTTTAQAYAVLNAVDALIGRVDGGPSALIGNARSLAVIRQAVRFANMYVRESRSIVGLNGNGGTVERYGENGPILFDAGKRIDGSTDVVRFSTTDPDSAGPLVAGSTDLYAVQFGLNAFHGVSVPGQLVKTWLPDFTTPGAVKTGEVEMGPVAMVLKRTRGAAVLRNFKVA